jgi:hypothetical protein
MKFFLKIVVLFLVTTSAFAQFNCGGGLNRYRWGNLDAMFVYGALGPNVVTNPNMADFYALPSVASATPQILPVPGGDGCGLSVNLYHLNGGTHSSLTFAMPQQSFSSRMLLSKSTQVGAKFTVLLLEAPADIFAIDIQCPAGSNVCGLYYSELDGVRKDTLIRFKSNEPFDINVSWNEVVGNTRNLKIEVLGSRTATISKILLSSPFGGFSAIHSGKPNEAGTITGASTIAMDKFSVF